MITVYDMTSGTLRKELEASSTPSETKPALVEHDGYNTELQLQEIEFEQPASDSLPAHLLATQTDEFIDSMK